MKLTVENLIKTLESVDDKSKKIDCVFITNSKNGPIKIYLDEILITEKIEFLFAD